MNTLSPANPLPAPPPASSPRVLPENGATPVGADDLAGVFASLLGALAGNAAGMPADVSDLASSSDATDAAEAASLAATTAPLGDGRPPEQTADQLPLTGAMMPSPSLGIAWGGPPVTPSVIGADGNSASAQDNRPLQAMPSTDARYMATAIALPTSPRPTSPIDGERRPPAMAAASQSMAEMAAIRPTPALPQESGSYRALTNDQSATDNSPALVATDGAADVFGNMAGPVPTDNVATTKLKLPAGAPEQWRSSLVEALGERIQIAVGKHSEHAVIRLDPPMMGSIEIVVRHQAGNLQVQLSATNNEVVRQLQSIGDTLRQDLLQNQYTGVSVQVFADARQGGRQQPEPEELPPGRALAEADDGRADAPFALDNV